MSKIPFNKPALTHSEQLNQLKERGLIVNDDKKAIHLLTSISYYRLSGYWYPMLEDKENHKFKKDSNFDDVFKLYCFDRALRKLILSELEKIEIAVRANMIYILSHKYGPFWFTDSSLFIDIEKHKKFMDKIHEEYLRSDEQFIKAFNHKYTNQIPPAWISLEVTSFGTLSKLYTNLKSGLEKKEIANHFGITDFIMEKWLHTIVYLRNVCAHHSRLWNRTMRIYPKKPKKLNNPWINTIDINNNTTYFMLSMIKYLLQTVNPNSKFKHNLKALFNEFDNVDINAMNFPEDWEKEELWM